MSQQRLRQAKGHGKVPRRLPAHEWASLQSGECVEVWSEGSFRYEAFVDDLAHDGRFLWIIEDDTGCRRLFVRGDPVDLYTFSETGSIMTKAKRGTVHG